MQTVLITGCSSGFGLDLAHSFHARGWSVIAAMRRPDPALLPTSDRMRVIALDVTDPASIAETAKLPIDVLVNNAGIGWLNAHEGTPPEAVQALFATNTFGPMELIRAVLSQMRARRAGVIVNVSSSVTLKPLHLLSAYTASKAALNAFTEVLALELAPFGIRAHTVLPGRAPETRFGANAQARMTGIPEAYGALAQEVFARFGAEDPGALTRAEDVTAAVWRAATDPSAPARLPAGADAVAAFQG